MKGLFPTLPTVAQRLSRDGLMEEVGLSYYSRLVDGVPRPASPNIVAQVGELKRLRQVLAVSPSVEMESDVSSQQQTSGVRGDQASRLIQLVRDEGVELFHDRDGDAYASIRVEGHLETHAVASRSFSLWIKHHFYERFKKVPRRQIMQDALATLEGRAQFEGLQHPVALRIAVQEGAIYVDLGTEQWDVVKITAEGWRVVRESSVHFRRAPGMYALPYPQRGGSTLELGSLLNLACEDDLILVVGWLLAALRPDRPYPILVVNGEKGSAKSSACRLLRRLVDPNKADLRRPPRDGRDLMVAMRNGHVCAFDNVSRVPESMGDDLCALATGSGFSTRTLYTNAGRVDLFRDAAHHDERHPEPAFAGRLGPTGR